MKNIRSAWPVFILAMLSFVYFADLFISKEIFSFRDLSRYYYPLRLFSVELIKSGNFPFWNPYIACGHPLFATLQSVVLYPLSIIYYIGNFDTAFNLFIVLHVFLGGLFFYFLMKDLKYSKAASLISAMVFSYGGYLISVINLTTTLASAIWFPLVFLFYKRLIERGKIGYLILTSVFLGIMFLGGEPTPLYSTIFLLGLYTLIVSFSDGKKLLKNLLLYTLCIALFALLFSFQILPLWELVSLSDRTYSSFDKATFWSFHPRNVVNFLLPFFHGPPLLRSYDEPSPLTQDWLLLSYLGIMPTILFIISIIFKKDRCTTFFKVGFIAGLIFIFGRFTPLYEILYRYVPGFSFIRYPVKFFFINAMCFSYLCGAGFSEYWRRVKIKDPALLRFSKGLLILGFIVSIIFLMLYLFKGMILSQIVIHSEHLELAQDGKALAHYLRIATNFFNMRRMFVFIIAGALILFVGSKKRLKEAVFVSLIATLIFVDYYGEKNIQVNPSVSKEALHRVTPNLRIIKEDKGLFRVYTSREQGKINEVLRGTTYEEAIFNSIDSLCANRPMEHGIQTARGYLSIHNARYAKIMIMLDTAPLPSSTNILNMLNVKYILTPEKIDDSSCRFVNKGAAYLYENTRALPRAYLVPDYVVLEDEKDIADKMRLEEWDPESEVILEEEPELVSRIPLPVSRKEHVDIASYESNEVIIEVNVKDEPKFLVLADNYYPGWQVEVDGEKERLYRANFILKSVFLPPGEHTVRFYYNPVSFKIGSIISLLTLITLCLVKIIKVRHTR